MGNQASAAVGMMAAKQKLGSLTEEKPKPKQAPNMRASQAEKRKERDAEFERKKAERAANKGKLSQKWAENKARERSG